MAKILAGPWTSKKDATPTLPEQLNESQQLLLEPLIEAQQALVLAAIPFRTSGDIRPLHCRKTLNALEDINAHTATFCNLLTEAASLPVFTSSFRYSLLTNLYRIREQTLQAIALVDAYRVAYKSMRIQKRQEISKAVEYISNELQDFFLQIRLFDTEIRFQQVRLATLITEMDQHHYFTDAPN